MKKSVVIGVAKRSSCPSSHRINYQKLSLIDKLLCRADGLTGKLSDFCDVIPKGEEKNVSKNLNKKGSS